MSDFSTCYRCDEFRSKIVRLEAEIEELLDQLRSLASSYGAECYCGEATCMECGYK